VTEPGPRPVPALS